MLRKREALREVFGGFDPAYVADLDVEPLLADARLIRSRPKLQACVTNARATAAAPRGRAARRWCAGTPRRPGARAAGTPCPPPPRARAALAKELKRAGFTFVGPVTAYSLLQACGLVGDHLRGCDVREEVEAQRSAALAVP